MRKSWLAVSGAVIASYGLSGPLEDSARRIVAEYASVVVPVTAVLKIEVPGNETPTQEQTIETYGTVLSTNGLTVLSATSLNPVGGLGAMEMPIGGRIQTVTPRGTVTQIRVRLADGEEIAMRQVLTDEDLDLTFLAPDLSEGGAVPTFPRGLDFSHGSTVEVMDEVVAIGRAGKLFNWAPAVGTCRIIARVEKPRLLYLFGAGFVGGTGTPVFSVQGQPIGLVVMRRQRATGPRTFAMNQAAVIVPAVDVADLSRRAQEAVARAKSVRDTPR